MQPLISINGQLSTPSSVGISPFDRGIMLGDGIFETVFVDRNGPWYLVRHLTRLAHSAQVWGISLPKQLEEWIDQVVQAGLAGTTGNLALRITITRGGTEPHGLAGPDTLTPLAMIAVFEAPTVLPIKYELGMSAQIAEARRNERSLLAGIKSTSYAESILALRIAQAADFDDVVFLNTVGFVAEASASNLFIVMDGALITPPITHGILPGITRAVVLELAAQHGIPAAEREIGVNEMLNSAEVFLTSSLRGIVPLVRVNEQEIGNGAPGEVTRRVMRLYGETLHRV